MLRSDFLDPEKDAVRFTQDPQVSELLKGAVDLHQHPGPSPFPRRMTIMEAVEDAASAGFRALVCKSHHDNTAPMIEVLRTAGLDSFGVQVLGGVALNWYEGNVSPYVVENALYSGAKIVWMPTLSSASHLAKEHAPGSVFADSVLRLGPANRVTDDNGAPTDDVRDIFGLIAQYDAILNFGHLSADEIDAILPAAVEAGVTRMIVSHPPLLVDATPERTANWARQGARIEHVIGNVRRLELDQLAAYVTATGLQNTYLASDYGQKHNPLPVSGFMFTVRRLLDGGWSEDDVRRFVSGTAGELIDGIA
ncbi:hypothetical protein BH11ACT4_BH11ACT4_13380 [soil metagenome]